MLDHVEGVGGVEASRDLPLEVPDRRLEPAACEPPAQVGDRWVVEVGELDPIAGLEQRQPVGADPAAVVEQPRPRPDQAGELAQVGELGPRHRERGQVVEVGLGLAVERLLVREAGELALELALVVLQPAQLEACAQVLLELGLLARRGDLQRRHRGHDSGGSAAAAGCVY